MTPEVQKGIKEIRDTFVGHHVTVVPDGQGGAYVIVHPVLLGEKFHPRTAWFGCHITFQYPNGDVYPWYMDGGVKKAGGAAMQGDGVSGPLEWQNRSALQLSRRSHKWNPATDTAAIKLLKIIEWVKAK